MNKIYLVTYSVGEYSDRSEGTILSTTSKELAEKFVKYAEAVQRIVKLTSKSSHEEFKRLFAEREHELPNPAPERPSFHTWRALPENVSLPEGEQQRKWQKTLEAWSKDTYAARCAYDKAYSELRLEAYALEKEEGVLRVKAGLTAKECQFYDKWANEFSITYGQGYYSDIIFDYVECDVVSEEDF